MQLLLTVVDPRGATASADLLVDAPIGTPLGAVRRQLLSAVGCNEGSLFARDQPLGDDSALGEPPLLDGAVLTVDQAGHAGHAEPRGLLELHVLAGPDSGAVHRLTPGEHGIGRAAEAAVRVDDPEVSRLHAVLRVSTDGAGGTSVHDLSSTNGSYVDGDAVGVGGRPLRPGEVLRVGGTRLSLAQPETVPVSCRPDGDGHLEINRPPRHLRPSTRLTVTMPPEPPARERGRFPLVAVLLPLVAGVVLVAVTRSPTYLLFVLLSPLLVLGTFLSDRTGAGRAARAQRSAHAEQTARITQTVARTVAEESAAHRYADPGAAAMLLTATGPRPRLWERRRGDDDALELRLGLGTVASSVEVRTPGGASRSDEVEHPVMTEVPVTVRLAEAGVLGLAGSRGRVLPVARSLVAQLACWHSPRHLSLAVLSAQPSPDWDWARWLPHARAGGGGRVAVVQGTARLRAGVDELLALLDARTAGRLPGVATRWTGPSTVLVLDGAGALRRLAGVTRLLEEGPAVGLRALCLERDLVSLPVECRATAEVTGPVGTGLRVVAADSTTYDDVVADGVSDRWAQRYARALAPLRDATPDDQQNALPDAVRLLDVLAFDAADPAALETAWRVGPRDTRVTLGAGTAGEPFVVDLAADGPHVLIAGTTGSGKSELLQTLVAGLAVANRPDEMAFVLIDYKGGAAFKECARLPHTVGTVTDLDGHLTERALRSLGAELRRRETVLHAAGCKDLDDYRAQAPGGSPPLGRLVLVVDEFATLAEELPDFIGGLVAIAQRGRSLGVHLVLATQRPGGVVSADIRANCALRVALRVTDPGESTDVVDVRDAADIELGHPGRAVVRVGAGSVRGLQAAWVGGHAVSGTSVSVRAAPWDRAGDLRVSTGTPGTPGPSDLARLVEAACSAARRLGAAGVPSPWLPPLPPVVTLDDLAGLAATGGEVPVGILDLPSEQRRAAVTFDLVRGDHLLVAGGARSGRSTLLRTLAAALALRCDVTDLHLFGLDGGSGALSAVAGLAHCGAVVSRDETERGDRLLSRLVDEVRRRQRMLAAGGLGSHQEQRDSAEPADRLPWLVLLVDGWEGLAAAYEAVDHGRPLDTLLQLVREGAAVGLRVVLTGDRGVLSGRAGAAFRDRLVLRLADPADYGLAGIAARQVPATMPPGRALVGPDACEAQLAVLGPDGSGAGQVQALARVAAAVRCRPPVEHAHPGLLPLHVDPLPARLEGSDVEAAAKAASTGPGWALVGVGGDELAPTGVDLDADGPAFVIAGAAGSGRSTTLVAMGRWLLGQGREVLVVAHRRTPLRQLAGEPGVVAALGTADATELEGHLRAHPDVVVLADDAETLHDTPVERLLLGLLRADAEGGAALLLAGSSADLGGCFRGLTVEARRGRTGLLLGASSPVDGDLLGVRLPRSDGGPPGRAVLVVRGRATPVQVALPVR